MKDERLQLMYKAYDIFRVILWAFIFIYVLHIIPVLAENLKNAVTLPHQIGYVFAIVACFMTIISCVIFLRKIIASKIKKWSGHI
jgi:predicted PurR-regulated permease PerM